MKKLLLLSLLYLTAINAYSQYSQLQLGDSTQRVYQYKLPILGKAAYEQGFDIPLAAGGMLNYFWADQGILISDISVGFNGGDMYDISEIIEFGEVHAVATSVNVRPDIWIFPFLNLYGIFGKTWATTTVEIAAPVEFTAIAELEGATNGIGITGASGLGKYFFVFDGNWTWTKMTNFEEAVQTKNFSFRFGRAFQLTKNPNSNLAVWAGGMRLTMGGVTEGTITLNEVLPPETWERKDEIVTNYWEWYDGLSPIFDPVKYKVATELFNPIVEKIDEADGSSTVSYSVRKEPKQRWNMIIGGQFQLNQHHQFRVEGGVLGDRTSLLLSYNYRFGI